MLGYFWIFTSISLCIGLYKLELSKRVIDEEYEYIKKHRAFGNLTKYLTIIAIIIIIFELFFFNISILLNNLYIYYSLESYICQ